MSAALGTQLVRVLRLLSLREGIVASAVWPKEYFFKKTWRGPGTSPERPAKGHSPLSAVSSTAKGVEMPKISFGNNLSTAPVSSLRVWFCAVSCGVGSTRSPVVFLHEVRSCEGRKIGCRLLLRNFYRKLRSRDVRDLLRPPVSR